MTAELRLWNRADFNPRSPHGERHSGKRNKVCHKSFQSTLPARGATGEQYATTSYVDISIHAPRTGSDIIGAGTIVRPLTISIHAPRTGSDVEISDLSRGGDISIHAPRTGSDHAMFLPHTGRHYFNPRSPHGERPYLLHPMERFGNYFNPRSPHGERHYWYDKLQKINLFQSTLPARGATYSCRIPPSTWHISIHAPRTGSDTFIYLLPPYFSISIHAPRTGSDFYVLR